MFFETARFEVDGSGFQGLLEGSGFMDGFGLVQGFGVRIWSTPLCLEMLLAVTVQDLGHRSFEGEDVDLSVY